MQNSLDRIFDALEQTLRDLVAPAITDSYVRTQVTAVAEIIGNLSTRVQWRTDQLVGVCTRVRPILELAASAELPETTEVLAAPVPTTAWSAEELLAARQGHLLALREVQQRLVIHPDDEIESAVRDFLRWQVAEESALLRTGMFSAPKSKEVS